MNSIGIYWCMHMSAYKHIVIDICLYGIWQLGNWIIYFRMGTGYHLVTQIPYFILLQMSTNVPAAHVYTEYATIMLITTYAHVIVVSRDPTVTEVYI